MPVKIHNKDYFTVAERVAKLREDRPLATIDTELVSDDGERVIVRAAILEGPELIATGYAEEVRGSTNINQTSALENCETSAVGRALAFAGLAGTEIASAEEVGNAIAQQTEKTLFNQFAAHMDAVRDHWDSVAYIKECLNTERSQEALEAWRELGEDVMRVLWRAPSKGGVFTTLERKQLDEASNEDHKRRQHAE